MTYDYTKRGKEEPMFSCLLCKFNTGNKYNFNRHLTTAKHKKMTIIDKEREKDNKQYCCENCGKRYKHRQGLSFHRKKCK